MSSVWRNFPFHCIQSTVNSDHVKTCNTFSEKNKMEECSGLYHTILKEIKINIESEATVRNYLDNSLPNCQREHRQVYCYTLLKVMCLVTCFQLLLMCWIISTCPSKSVFVKLSFIITFGSLVFIFFIQVVPLFSVTPSGVCVWFISCHVVVRDTITWYAPRYSYTPASSLWWSSMELSMSF